MIINKKEGEMLMKKKIIVAVILIALIGMIFSIIIYTIRKDFKDAYNDIDYRSESFENSLSREEKLKMMNLDFEDKNYARLYYRGNVLFCHLDNNYSKLVVDKKIKVENSADSIPDEIPVIIKGEKGNIEGKFKSFKQGYLLTDAGILYYGELDFKGSNSTTRSYNYCFERVSKDDEHPVAISVELYTVDREKMEIYRTDTMSAYFKTPEDTISIPYYGYLEEEEIIDSSVITDILSGVYCVQDTEQYYLLDPEGIMIDNNNKLSSCRLEKNTNLIKFGESQYENGTYIGESPYAYGIYTVHDDSVEIKLVKKNGKIIKIKQIDVDNQFFEKYMNNTPFSVRATAESMLTFFNKIIF